MSQNSVLAPISWGTFHRFSPVENVWGYDFLREIFAVSDGFFPQWGKPKGKTACSGAFSSPFSGLVHTPYPQVHRVFHRKFRRFRGKNPVTIGFSEKFSTFRRDLWKSFPQEYLKKTSLAENCVFGCSKFLKVKKTSFKKFFCGVPRGFAPWRVPPYTSRFSAYRAFCSIKSRRGSTASPMRRENMASQAIASSMVTRKRVRDSGSMVVSRS